MVEDILTIIGKSYVFSDAALKNGIVYGIVANYNTSKPMSSIGYPASYSLAIFVLASVANTRCREINVRTRITVIAPKTLE